MPCIVFAYFALASFVVHATQDCQGNDCPVKVNSLLQVHGSAQIEVEAPYSKSTTNACTMGFQRILSEDECRTAANALGFSYKKKQIWPEHAPGCLKWDGDGPNVYYNDHETGRTDGASNATMAICKEAPLLSSDTIGDEQSITAVPRTFIALVKVPSGISGRGGIIAGSYPNNNNINWEIHEDGAPRLWWLNGQVDWYPNTDLRTGTWVQVAFVVNEAGTEAHFYVDGSLLESKSDFSQSRGDSFADEVPEGTFVIGDDHRASWPMTPIDLQFEIACVKIFSSELSTADIAQHCQATTTTTTA